MEIKLEKEEIGRISDDKRLFEYRVVEHRLRNIEGSDAGCDFRKRKDTNRVKTNGSRAVQVVLTLQPRQRARQRTLLLQRREG